MTDPGLRILIAEDDRINRMVLQELLRAYAPVFVENGVQVLEETEKTDYDLVLMDIQMPELDGINAAKEIRRRSCREERPWIVAVSAGSSEGDRARYGQAGMNDFIEKPISMFALRQTLDKARQSISSGMKENPLGGPAEGRPDPGSTFPVPFFREGAFSRTATPRDESELIDLDDLLDRCLGDKKNALRLVQVFFDHFPATIREMKHALDSGLTGQLGLLAHRLKGSAVTLGAISLEGKLQELENMTRPPAFQDRQPFYNRLDFIQQLGTQLETFLRTALE